MVDDDAAQRSCAMNSELEGRTQQRQGIRWLGVEAEGQMQHDRKEQREDEGSAERFSQD